MKERQNVLLEIEKLLDIDPANIPAESKFLLEMDFGGLYRSSFEKQGCGNGGSIQSWTTNSNSQKTSTGIHEKKSSKPMQIKTNT